MHFTFTVLKRNKKKHAVYAHVGFMNGVSNQSLHVTATVLLSRICGNK